MTRLTGLTQKLTTSSVAAGIVVLLAVSRAGAIPPPFVSDQSLAESPIIVVAKWNRAAWDDKSLVEGNLLKEHELRTQIEIERVIQGDIEPGTHTILVGFAIGWSDELPVVTSYMSTEMIGDAEATKPNLWFLERKRSRIESDTTEYLFLKTYRGVQPLELEPYFTALGEEDPASHVDELLSSRSEAVLMRTLEMISGDDRPWPYEPWRFVRPESDDEPLTDQADAVRLLFERTDNDRVRRLALAVYAHLTGTDGLDFVEQQLGHADPDVRGIAVGTLAHHRRAPQADGTLARAVVGIEDPHLACEVIGKLRQWNDPAAVPALIPFLQNDGLAFIHGNDLGIPAIKAQEALKQIVGYTFPFDVAASQRAWTSASAMEDRAKRKEYLAQELPSDASPWRATVARLDGRITIEVTNRSRLTYALARVPSDVSIRWSSGVSGWNPQTERDDEDAFVTLNAGESFRFDLEIPEALTGARGGPGGKLDLGYYTNGNDVGVNAWLGVVTAPYEGE